jgi:hypothetical protein
VRTLFLLALVVLVVAGGLKAAGVRLPLIDYPLGPIGVDTPGPAVPEVQVEAPGFGEFGAP